MHSDDVFEAKIASGLTVSSSAPHTSPLDVEALDDGLDHEVAIGQVLEPRGPGEPGEGAVTVVRGELAPLHPPVEELLDALPALGQLVVVGLPDDRVEAGLCAHLGDSGPHQPTPDHADASNFWPRGRRICHLAKL